MLHQVHQVIGYLHYVQHILEAIQLIGLYDILLAISHTHQTHLLSYYAFELANEFHNYYANNSTDLFISCLSSAKIGGQA